MREKKIEIPARREVIVNGEEIKNVKEITPPSMEKPYWTVTISEEDYIIATGNVSVRHLPGASLVIKFFSPTQKE